MPLIELVDVCKTYDLGEVRVEALKNARLSVDQGEFVALIGPSGSGKSTLMNTLGCLDRPTSGSYRLAGEEITTMSNDDRANIRNRRIGFVFQNFNLLTRTTALENVELPLLYTKGITSAERKRRAIESLTKVGLENRLDHHPSQLSGGQQQRVAIARALVNQPAILMADEPTGNLDSKTSREVIGLFRELNESTKITIFLVTHDANVAKSAKRIVVLHDGGIVCDTTDYTRALNALQSGFDGDDPSQQPASSL